jgi:3-isopropylmalate/(R)-2-methylmalate dehydratase small subunit
MASIWVFNGERSSFPSGVFSTRDAAEAWIARHRLTGTLTRYPLDTGVYDWAVSRGHFRPAREHQRSPEFIARFSSASQDHEHFEHGRVAGPAHTESLEPRPSREPRMDPFTQHRGKVAVLDWTDVNTDLIIPARYLKRIERTGYGPLLFADKRYAKGEAPPVDDPRRPAKPDPDFPLNRPEFAGATILVVGRNFGCGSSREHAVWAVQQGGFRALIAPVKGEGFADIFEGNAYNNGLLPIELPEDRWREIADACRPGGAEATIDLESKSITVHAPDGSESSHAFDVPEALRRRLLQGLDFIAETLQGDDAIRAYEQSAPAWAAHPG